MVCIGASAGGLTAIGELLSYLPKEVNAAVFIVLHLSKTGLEDTLARRIQRNTTIPCKIAENDEMIEPGNIYVAPPGAHLLLKKDQIIIGHGPPENRYRPSIDVLFRSAALYYQSRAIGIVLTGLLNDGSSGMLAIKQSGGICIVQDPNEAEYPEMPASVLETMESDYCEPINKMGQVIMEVTSRLPPKPLPVPEIIVAEAKLSERSATAIEDINKLGPKTDYGCPDCGGPLWEIKSGKLKHYRCHIGHTYSDWDLEISQSRKIEQTLWVAIRMMEERKTVLLRMSSEHRHRGLLKSSGTYKEQAKNLEQHIEQLKKFIFQINVTD